MQIIVAFLEFALGYVPLIAIVLATTTALWAATKLIPSFGAWFETMSEKLFGVDENYDERYAPASTTSIDQYV